MLFLPSLLFCCSLFEKDDVDRHELCFLERMYSRSFSINTNFLFKASISFSFRRSSTCTRLKPSSHSLLISSTAALANISMMLVNLLWKAVQLPMSIRSGVARRNNGRSPVRVGKNNTHVNYIKSAVIFKTTLSENVNVMHYRPDIVPVM